MLSHNTNMCSHERSIVLDLSKTVLTLHVLLYAFLPSMDRYMSESPIQSLKL